MKHTRMLTVARPAQASLIEVQQKVAVVTAAIEAFGLLGEALGSWLDLFGGE